MKKIYLLLICLFIFSCASFKANYFLVTNTSQEAKADLLYKEGVRRYKSNVLEDKRLDKIDDAVSFINDAIELYPEHKGAREFLLGIEKHKESVLASSLNSVRDLDNREDRTELENYRYVLSVMNILDLGESTEEIKAFKKNITNPRKELIKTYKIRLNALEARILKEKEYSPLLSLLRKCNITLIQLDSIDRNNSKVRSTRKSLEKYIGEFTTGDIVIARKHVDNKQFIEAELVVRQIGIRHNAISKKEIPYYDRLKYDLFFNWAVELLNQGKYQLSSNILALAYEIEDSQEVIELEKRLEKGLKKSNFESTISDVIASVDYYINIENPSKAIWVVNSYINRFTRESSKAALTNKRDEIYTMVDLIYKKGVALFDEEDYEGALEVLEVVWDFDQGYKQVAGYYSRSKNRYSALKGEV